MNTIAAAVGEPTVPGGTKLRFWSLAIGSIGVVYGDIGTSTLYAFREAILAATGSGGAVNEPVVLGILSLIVWALLFIVTAKYVVILLRADNKGEGGTLALMALASHALMRRGGIILR
jgi:KUP system potassium uptake protein